MSGGEQAAAEYGQYGIKVNCIAPGFHRGTRLPESMGKRMEADESRLKMITTGIPLGRMAEPREIKGLLLYLASDSCSFMTGETIVYDGGQTIW